MAVHSAGFSRAKASGLKVRSGLSAEQGDEFMTRGFALVGYKAKDVGVSLDRWEW